MLILALDSTATVASVALCHDEAPIASFTVKNGNTHSETLLPMVEAVLRAAQCTVSDVDLFACSVGPGSFTGVRIGTATIKGLAFGKNKCCIGVSTLEALAQNLVPFEGLICPVMNARRGQLYNALFKVENGVPVRLCPDRAIAATELAAELTACGLPFALCGDGVDELLHLAPNLSPAGISTLLCDQCAVSVAKVALRAKNRGESGTDATLNPIYLRMPQAERERLEKQKQENPLP